MHRLGSGVIIDSLPSFFLKVISRGSRCIFTADVNFQGRLQRRGGLCAGGRAQLRCYNIPMQTAHSKQGMSAGAAAGRATGGGFTAR